MKSARIKQLLFFFSCLLTPVLVFSQASLVADLTTTAASSGPLQAVQMGDYIFFSASTVQGQELWKTDGTANQTVLTKDICPGGCGYIKDIILRSPTEIVFFAYTKEQGLELWKTDGSASGTVMVKDIWMGPDNGCMGGQIHDYAVIDEVIYFSANDGIHGDELWRSDGTLIGTFMVKDIFPGKITSRVKELAVFGDQLFFSADDGVNGMELWLSDGTAAGTHLLKNINAGSAPSNPEYFTEVSGTLFFVASNGIHGAELWKTDGTADGTMMVRDIRPGSGGSHPTSLWNGNGKLLFVPDQPYADPGNIEPWVSDGTSNGTLQLGDLNPGQGGSVVPTDRRFFCNLDGDSYFVAQVFTGIAPDYYYSGLFRTDGTSQNTVLIKNMGHRSSTPDDVFVAHGLMFFSSQSDAGMELWRTDGTEPGTFRLDDVIPSLTSFTSSPVDHSYFFFPAFDEAHGIELWKTDGTTSGSSLLSDLTPGTAGSTRMSPLVKMNHELYFISDRRFYQTDGTSVTTLLNGATGAIKALSNQVVFTASPNHLTDTEPWTSDGTLDGTIRLKDIFSGTAGSSPREFLTHNNEVYFAASTGQLWRTDGTSGNTTLIKDINVAHPANLPRNLQNLTEVNGTIFFMAFETPEGPVLWRTNGTAQGTQKVKSFRRDLRTNAAAYAELPGFAALNGVLFFGGYTVDEGLELWRSDGTAAGTYLISDINPGPFSSIDSTLPLVVRAGNQVFFLANDGVHGMELWKSDGTTEGTQIVKDLAPGTQGISIRYPVAYKDQLYFVFDDGAHGEELWVSDGTAEGTHIVKDIAPGMLWSAPIGLSIANELLFFSATDGVNGKKLWNTDGTTEGTFVIADVMFPDLQQNQTKKKSFLKAQENLVTELDDYLYFFATGSVTGNELWKLKTEPHVDVVYHETSIRSGDEIDLGEVVTGESSTAIPLFIHNTSLATGYLRLGGSGVSIEGADAGEFIFDDSQLAPVISPSSWSQLTIRFAPHSAGEKMILLKVFTNDPDEPVYEVKIKGNALKLNQTIQFDPLDQHVFGDAPFMLNATASSGLPISYRSSDPEVAVIDGNQLTIVGAGSAAIVALQNGNSAYAPATEVEYVMTVAKASQTIQFSALAEVTYGDASVLLTATADSNLPVSYHSQNTDVILIEGNQAQIAGAGTAVITAYQSGNKNYHPATEVSQLVIVSKGVHTISWMPSPADLSLAKQTIKLHAVSSAGLAVVYSSNDLSVATVSGDIVTLHAAGTVTFTASGSPNVNYQEASAINTTICVLPPAPVISADPSGKLMISSAGEGNQWYLNGVAINAASSQTYEAADKGIYSARVTIDGCPGAFSNSLNIEEKDQDQTNDEVTYNSPYLWPNPATDRVWVSLFKEGQTSLEILNSTGQVVKRIDPFPAGNIEIDLTDLAAGVYLVKIGRGGGHTLMRFVKI